MILSAFENRLRAGLVYHTVKTSLCHERSHTQFEYGEMFFFRRRAQLVLYVMWWGFITLWARLWRQERCMWCWQWMLRARQTGRFSGGPLLQEVFRTPRWIMTSKIGTKIVVTRCVSQAQNMPKMRLRAELHPGPRWGSLQRFPRPLAGRGEEDSEEDGIRGPWSAYSR